MPLQLLLETFFIFRVNSNRPDMMSRAICFLGPRLGRTLNGTNQGLMMDIIKSLETYIHQIREAKQIILQKEAEAQKAIEEITRALSGRTRISLSGK